MSELSERVKAALAGHQQTTNGVVLRGDAHLLCYICTCGWEGFGHGAASIHQRDVIVAARRAQLRQAKKSG